MVENSTSMTVLLAAISFLVRSASLTGILIPGMTHLSTRRKRSRSHTFISRRKGGEARIIIAPRKSTSEQVPVQPSTRRASIDEDLALLIPLNFHTTFFD